jgi:outer membrane protein W
MMEEVPLRKYVVLGLCLMIVAAAASYVAADTSLMGRNEIMAAGAWVDGDADGDSVSATIIGVNYGHFVSDKWELQAGLIYADADLDGPNVSATIFAPAAVYHFVPEKPSAIVPYLGLGLAYGHVNGFGDSDSSLKPMYLLGAKFFIGGDYTKANKCVFLEYRNTDIDMFDTDIDVNMVWSGISVFL